MKPLPTLKAELDDILMSISPDCQDDDVRQFYRDAILQLISSQLPEEDPLSHPELTPETESTWDVADSLATDNYNDGFKAAITEVKALLESKE